MKLKIFDFLVDFKKNNNYNTFFEKNIDRFNYNYQLLVKYRIKLMLFSIIFIKTYHI
jgi:hypothetical protein